MSLRCFRLPPVHARRASLTCVEAFTTPPDPQIRNNAWYALHQLEDSGERKAAALAHANYFQLIFSQTRYLHAESTPRAWLTRFRNELGNLRAAFDWAFSPNGDCDVGVALAAVAVPLLFDVCWSTSAGSEPTSHST